SLHGYKSDRHEGVPRDTAGTALAVVVAGASALGRDAKLAADGQRVIVDRDVDILRLQTGQIQAQDDFLVVLNDIHRRAQERLAAAATGATERPRTPHFVGHLLHGL